MGRRLGRSSSSPSFEVPYGKRQMTSPDRSGCGRGPPRPVFLEPHQLRAQFAKRNRQERIRDGGEGWGRAAAGSLVVASRGNRPYSSLFTSPTIGRIADIHWTRQRTCLVRVKYARMSPEPCFRHTDNVCRYVVRKRAALRNGAVSETTEYRT